MKKAHFIGICGVGMSAVAELLKESGWEVTGSDSGFYPPVSDYLSAHHIPFNAGYRKENIPQGVDLIVIGKHAGLTPEENEEVRAAYESGASIQSYPEVLGSLVGGTRNLVVAGSYGKSTCTALLAHCLVEAALDPSFFIGAIPVGSGESAHLGGGNFFVLEGDEYPSSNWDATSKFLHYHPRDVLLTSAEHDHVNVFPTHADYLLPFKTLLSLLPPEGLLVGCADEPAARALLQTHPGKKVLYGLDHPESQWSARNIRYGAETAFELTRDGETVAALRTTLLGKHNIQNIVGVAALLLSRELLTPETLARAVLTFRGIKRRLERKTDRSSVPIYEGFGSSYQKARAAIEAMRLHFPDRRLVVIFEPHTFSWRNRDTLHWYDDVFKDVGVLYMLEPAAAGKETHRQLSRDEIVERVTKSGTNVRPADSPVAVLEDLRGLLTTTDAVLLLSSGEMHGLPGSVPKVAEELFPHENLQR